MFVKNFHISSLLKENMAPEKNMQLEFKMCTHVSSASKNVCVTELCITKIICEMNRWNFQRQVLKRYVERERDLTQEKG